MEIVHGFGMAVELELIEGGRVRQQLGNRPRGRHRGQFLLQMGYTLSEGQMLEEFDEADQVAAPPAAVAVEQVLASIHVERRAFVPMQGTQPHELRLNAGALSAPVVQLQVLQQRKMFFEPFQILLAHGGLRFLPDQQHEGSARRFPRQGWWAAADLSQA